MKEYGYKNTAHGTKKVCIVVNVIARVLGCKMAVHQIKDAEYPGGYPEG
jgi:hypothetical protein